MKSHKISQSGQAIIYVILLGASVLGAALVANQNILVDILRTKRLEEANIAYYQAEGAMEEALLDLKQGKSIPAKATNVDIPVSGQNTNATKKVSVDTLDRPLTSDELLPESKGVLKKDQSFTMEIPDEWKNVKGDSIPVVVAVGQQNIKDIYGETDPKNKRLEFREFNPDGTVHFIDFVGTDILRDPTLDGNKHPVSKTAKSIQFKPYGVDIKFSISAEGVSSYSGTGKKTIEADGSFGGSSRQITITVDEQTLKPLAIFDFGLFSQQSTDLNK